MTEETNQEPQDDEKAQRDSIKALIREALAEHDSEKEAARQEKEKTATKESDDRPKRTRQSAWFGLK